MFTGEIKQTEKSFSYFVAKYIIQNKQSFKQYYFSFNLN